MRLYIHKNKAVVLLCHPAVSPQCAYAVLSCHFLLPGQADPWPSYGRSVALEACCLEGGQGPGHLLLLRVRGDKAVGHSTASSPRQLGVEPVDRRQGAHLLEGRVRHSKGGQQGVVCVHQPLEGKVKDVE